MRKMFFIFVAETLLVLHGGDKQEVTINTEQVTSLRGPKATSDPLFAHGVKCLVGLTDGKFVTVTEDCETVRRLIGSK
jgi:hypothetical protein